MVEITLFESSAKELAMIPKQQTISFPSPIKVHPEISEEDFDADEAAAILFRELEAMDNTPLDAATSISSPVTSVPDTSVLVSSDPSMSIPVRMFLLRLFLVHLFQLLLFLLCLYRLYLLWLLLFLLHLFLIPLFMLP